MNPPVFLIGYRGTGKSTVARHLAALVDAQAVDSDQLIEQQLATSIADLFATEGEQAFRDHEQRVVLELCQRDDIVAALGGGAVLRAENRRAICEAGLVIWLTAKVDTLAARIAGDAHTASGRPSLTGASAVDEIADVLAARQPLYAECADFEVATDDIDPPAVADRIVEMLFAEAELES
jgi:shikimate kinase